MGGKKIKRKQQVDTPDVTATVLQTDLQDLKLCHQNAVAPLLKMMELVFL